MIAKVITHNQRCDHLRFRTNVTLPLGLLCKTRPDCLPTY